MKKLIKNMAAAILKGFARIAVTFNHIFHKGDSSQNPAGKGTDNEARPRKRLVDGVDAERFTRLCVVLVVGFVTLIGAVLVTAAVNSGSREIPVEQQDTTDAADGFTLSLGGAIMPSQDMVDCARGDGGYNFNNHLSELSATLAGDITIAGLCGQINVNGKNRDIGGFDNGKNYPDELAAAISETGINYVFGANQYAFANGYDGMCASISNLHVSSVGVIGLTNTDPQKLNTNVIRMNGVGVGIAGYNCVTGKAYNALSDEQKTYIAQTDKDAEALADRASADIAKMRGNGAEFIVICVNWGGAGSLEPNDFIRQAAQKLAAAGADVVIGYGPYVTMEAEVISSDNKECYVFYSLGVMFGDNHSEDSAVNKAMSRSMTVNLKAVRAKNGAVKVESAAYSPIYLVRNTAQSEENSHLKYMAVQAANYVAAEERPAIFADDKQWQLCREAFTEICALADKSGGRLILTESDKNTAQTTDDTKI